MLEVHGSIVGRYIVYVNWDFRDFLHSLPRNAGILPLLFHYRYCPDILLFISHRYMESYGLYKRC
jgi:hypothetical protein